MSRPFCIVGGVFDEDDMQMLRSIGRHSSARRLDDFLAQGARCGWCAHPIRLRGYVLGKEDGRVVVSSHQFPDNVLLKACGSRSELRCPSCAALYRGDARHLVRAGLEGGKGMDESVAEHPAVFMTLTAPGFGAVHRENSTGACQPERRSSHCRHGRLLVCRARHANDDQAVGAPLCARCYDYAGAVLQNAHSAELWRRTTIYITRQLAASLGISRAECAKVLRLEHAKVAEFQHRGLVHFHAVVRADAPGGTAPAIDVAALAAACRTAAKTVEVHHARGTARWGSELDVRVIERDGPLTPVASYVAKYATKEPAMHPGLLGRILSESDLKRRNLPPHLFNMVATAWTLSAASELSDLGLRRHAHHLGYTGHFLTKSRGYSTTFSALRDARAEWHRQRDGELNESATTKRLTAVGRGWANEGEALFAAAQARQRAEDKKEADFAWHTRSE